MKVSMSETIDAPLEEVFNFVSNPVLMAKAFPESVKKMEVLSGHEIGVGARFRETRLVRGREDVVEIETVEYIENERVLSLADTGGSLWYTGFAVVAGDSGTVLTVSMEAQAKSLLARVANYCMKPWLIKGGTQEMEGIKAHFPRSDAENENA
jgi:carbon monoxide dehydrogenase subunit G